jgi:hypothetical protein
MKIFHYPLSLDIMICKNMKVLHFTFFIGGYDFLKQHKIIMKTRWQGGVQLKQVVDEVGNMPRITWWQQRHHLNLQFM